MFLSKTEFFKRELKRGLSLDDILPETFAVVREASKRTTGMRHFDVQMIGGIILHQGKITEMRTGEGKTSPRRSTARLDRGCCNRGIRARPLCRR